MREIKFRAWDGKEMHLPEYADEETFFIMADGEIRFKKEEGYNRYPLTWQRKDWILMQYTGLKDKNGKDIYEGDVVKSWVPTTTQQWRHEENFQVVFKDGCFCGENDKRSIRLHSICHSTPLNEFFECEVIGNIYENPELITVPSTPGNG